MKKGLIIGMLSGSVMFVLGIFLACSLTSKTGGEGATGDIISPFAYGNINSNGTTNINSGNFSISNTSTGLYIITWNSGLTETFHSMAIVCVTPLNSTSPNIYASWWSGGSGALLYIYLRDDTGVAVNSAFNFIVYKP